MDIKIRKFDRNYIIDVSGEIDLYNAYRLKDVVRGMIEKQVHIFILSLKKATYIDSSGVGALMSVNAMLAQAGRSFRLVNVAKPVMRVLELTKLVGFLPINSNELEAIESVAGRQQSAR